MNRLGLVARLGALACCLEAAGCVSTWHDELSLPSRNTLARDQLLIHSDFPMATHHRLIEDLAARRQDLSEQLGLPFSDESIHVYVFDSADAFRTFMNVHYPEFPQRRAFFVETDTRLTVYAHWGDRVAEDLRHEMTHAYLHSVVPQIPLWLDEGLAEYFEVPRGNKGMNPAHRELLQAALTRGTWQPDLRRLELVSDPFAMSQMEYAECWAWVHFMLRTRVEHAELLRGYLRELNADGAAAPLSARFDHLIRQPETMLVEHIHQLGLGVQVAPASPQEPPPQWP